MAGFLKSQLDYIYFFYGASFLLLVPICLFLRRRPYVNLPWHWLAWFGATHGANEWLDLLALNLGSGPAFDICRAGLLIISYLCLAEFGRAGAVTLRGRGTGRWLLLVMACLAASGGAFGLAGVFVAARYFLGFPGALWAAGTLFLAAQTLEPASRSLRTTALGMAGYALATGLVVNRAPFFPASWLNFDSFLAVTGAPVQFVRGLLAVGISTSLCFFALASLNALLDNHIRSWFRNLMVGAMAGVIILLLGGWFLTQHLGNYAKADQRDDFRHYADMLQHSMLNRMEETGRFVRILAEAPSLLPALRKASPDVIQQVNAILDRCSEALPGSDCYLMDLQGLTIASSNRDQVDSFVGQSYAFRPYFREALSGIPGNYWALGVTSKEFGYYASFPVRDRDNRIVGVGVIKRSIEEIERIIPDHFIGLVINRDGIVVMANQANLVLKSLWPLNASARQGILPSRQLGEGPFAPILTQESVDDGECQWQGKRLSVMRQGLPWGGWSVVIMGPLWPIVEARFLGISLTLLLSLLLIGFLSIVAMTIESTARVTTSERLYRTLVEGAQSCISLFDMEGRFLAVNDNGLEALGWQKGNLLGQRFSRIWPEKAQARVDQAVNQTLGGQHTSFEAPYFRPDGRSLTWQVDLNPVFGNDKSVQGAVGIGNDISERKRTEEALLESEKRFRDVAENSQEWVWEVDVEGKFTYTSPVVEKLLGYKPEEILGKHFHDLFIPEDQAQIKEAALAIFPYKQSFREFINGNLHKDGRIVFLSTSGVPMFDHTGNFIGYRGANIDITGRKMAESALRESEERFRQLFEIGADILILHDRGKIIEVNQQACLCLGYSREELLGMTIFDIEMAFSKKYLIEQWEQSRDGVVETFGLYRRHDGSTFPGEIRISQFSYRGKNLRLVAVRDITERQRVEEELRVSEEALQKSREGYRNLAGYLMTAHEVERKRLGRELHDDLTQRLAALAMEAERIEQVTQTSAKAIFPNLKAIKDKLVELSMDTHALSRRLHPVILEDLGLNDAVVSECRAFAQREGIAVRSEAEDISEEVSPDVGLCVYRIIQEGLRNVAKHAGASEVLVSLVGLDGHVHVTIKDNGIGFDPAQLKKKGGLGLASMQERAHIIGGDFSIQSQPGQGTIIEVVAPYQGVRHETDASIAGR
jgi:PAS domain S-box-containing protein